MWAWENVDVETEKVKLGRKLRRPRLSVNICTRKRTHISSHVI